MNVNSSTTNISLSRQYTSTWYKEKLLDLLEMSPSESSYQDLIVYPLLDAIIFSQTTCNYELVDSKNFLQYNSKSHDRRPYSILAKAVPDLLITKDFFYENRTNDAKDCLKVISTVEVKEPNSADMKDIRNLKPHLLLEVFPCLYKNNKVIITNLKSWIFLKKDISILNEHTLKKLDLYIRIQELCGFDNIDECVNKNMGKRGRACYIVSEDALKTHWKDLCELVNQLDPSTRKNIIDKISSTNHFLKEYLDDNNKLSTAYTTESKKIFDDISKSVDAVFLEDIKDYFNNCIWDKPITLIDCKNNLVVNRLSPDNCSTITEISDFLFSEDDWQKLISTLSDFILEDYYSS